MRLSTIIRGMRQKSLFASFRAMGALTPFYRLSFAASAFTCSLVRLLADGPVPFEKIASRLAKDSGSHGLLRAWLDLGVRVGELGRGARGYSLKGYSRMIAAPERDPHAALFQEALSLHHDLIMNTPGKCARGEKWRPEEHDGRLIARSSRLGEPVVMEAVDRTFPRKGKVRLLEIGCGSGVYIRHAAERNPSLTAVGIELSEQAAVYARDNIREWGLEGRVRIENADIRKSAPAGGFDVATLHNNIYYFAEETRTDLLRHVKSLLNPGGMLLLTTPCPGGSPMSELLNLWGCATEGCGPLPSVASMKEHFTDAGFTRFTAKSLLPGDQYYAFTGYAIP